MSDTPPYRILLALTDNTVPDPWVAFAGRLVSQPYEIHLRGMVEVPEGTSLSEGVLQARQWRDVLYRLATELDVVHDSASVIVDYQPMTRLMEELNTSHYDLFLLQWKGPNDRTGGLTTNDILMFTPSDLVLVCRDQWGDDGQVLLSLRGGPNLTLGVQAAKALSGDAPITLFNVSSTSHTAPDLTTLSRSEGRIHRTVSAVGDITASILRELPGHAALVMGASFAQAEGKTVLQKVYEQSNLPLVVVRARQPEPLEFHPPQPIRRNQDNLSIRVDRWFAENTYDSQEFADLRTLLALKERQGVSISIGLPALNEEETVGGVIETLKTRLMEEIPLVDEIVLIDSNSTDNTVAIAESCGIPVYKHPEILHDEVGSYRGKGEALWKSLHVLKGDIIAWVDTDVTNIHPRFIYGLLGPLLKYPHLQYVKGFYQRPIKVGDKMQAYGGGRVTELVARPFFNLFYPELSGIVQPLSGEYAGRRAALEKVPFFSGYGVETGLLIDLLERFGLDSIAQSDLEVRVHHNQPLVGLSKMAFAVIQVFIARLENRYGMQLLEKANRSMKLIVHEPERFALEINEITDVERPPMMTIAPYRQKHQPAEAISTVQDN
jgi:glycosyltransferase involved in cell wall biosynthesis